MTIINGNDIQLIRMSEDNMTVMHMPGAACLHTSAYAHGLTGFLAAVDPFAGWYEFHQGELRGSHFWSFNLKV